MRELVFGTFAAQWPTLSGGVPFALENESLPTTADTFAQVTIVPTTSLQMTMGHLGIRRVRRNCWIQVKLWGPIDRGSAGLAALGDVVQTIFEMVELPSPVPGDDPVTTLAANAGASGASTDGRWYMGLVRVPMWYSETR